MSSNTPSWKVKYETGPCASDCYSLTVYANTIEAAKRVVEQKYPKAYVTEVERVKGTQMTRGMEFPQKFTAQDARKLTEDARSMEGEYMREQTNKILNDIRTVSLKGGDSLQAGKLDDVVSQRLKNLGYKVQWSEGYNQRDPGYTTISW